MRDRIERSLRLSNAVFLFSGYLALSTVRSYGPAVLLLPLLMIILAPIGEALHRRYSGYEVVTRAITIAYVCFIPLTLLLLDLLNGVLGLVIFVQFYTMAHEKDARNYYHIFLMNFFLLLGACVQSPEPSIAPVLGLFLVSAIWSFASLRIHVERQEAPQHGRIRGMQQRRKSRTLLGWLLRGESDDTVARQMDAPMLMGVFLVALASMGITAALFYLTPRIEAGIFGREQDNIVQTGLASTVDLMNADSVQEDPTPVMFVEFPNEPDGGYAHKNRLYWRCTSLPRYRSGRWTRSPLSYHYEALDRRMIEEEAQTNPSLLARDMRRGARIVKQVIYTDQVPEQGVPALDLVQRVELTGAHKTAQLNWNEFNDWTVELSVNGPRRITYEAWSEIVEDRSVLTSVEADFSVMERGDYELLTQHDLNEQTVALTEDIIEGQDTLYGMVSAVETYFSGPEFIYSLELPPLPQEHPIDAFISFYRIGHCELYATAMALMLRSQGIPTRVVSGYRGGEWSEDENAYIVRASMAHLWVEVYFPGEGWVVFDPSPGSLDLQEGLLNQLTLALTHQMLRAKMFWYQEVEGFDQGIQLDSLRNLSLRLLGGLGFLEQREAAGGGAMRPLNALLPLLMGLGIVAALMLLWRRRAPGPRPPYTLTDDQRRARELFRMLRKRLGAAEAHWSNRTAGEIRAAFAPEAWENGLVVPGLLDLYEDVRFGLRPIPDDEYARLRGELRQLKPRPSSEEPSAREATQE